MTYVGRNVTWTDVPYISFAQCCTVYVQLAQEMIHAATHYLVHEFLVTMTIPASLLQAW